MTKNNWHKIKAFSNKQKMIRYLLFMRSGYSIMYIVYYIKSENGHFKLASYTDF